jgi:hypothetical protein
MPLAEDSSILTIIATHLFFFGSQGYLTPDHGQDMVFKKPSLGGPARLLVGH